MTLSSTFRLSSAALTVALLASAAPVVANAGPLTVYFTRHAEKQTVTVESRGKPPAYTTNSVGEFIVGGGGVSVGSRFVEICGLDKCAEELSTKGEKRAMLLADWMVAQSITVDAVYATHKTRTQQTVQFIADDNDLDVINVVDGGTELSPEGTTASECATLQAIQDSIELNHQTIVIAGHSGTLYDIMGTGVADCFSSGLGFDTTTFAAPGNPDRFPKDGSGKVKNFGDLWKVEVISIDNSEFKYRKMFDFQELGVVESVY